MRRRRLPSVPTCLILLVALLLGVGMAHAPVTTARTIHVDCANTTGIEDGTEAHPYDTIQEGIGAALDGDTVLVQPCTYYENIDFLGKAITVTGTDPLDPGMVAATVIDASRTGSVVTFTSGEDEHSVLAGLTITRGYADVRDRGGGILCRTSSPTIRNNLITDNWARSGGGGIECWWHCSPRIMDNTITDNSGQDGGGIGSAYSAPVITGNLLADNDADFGGGGICCYSDYSERLQVPVISDNVLRDNHSDYYGGAVSLDSYCSAIVSGNTMTGNRAGSGGAVYCDFHSSAAITGNTITANIANDAGGAIVCDRSDATISDNLVRGNRSGGIYCADSSPLITGNLIVANGGLSSWGRQSTAGGIYCGGSPLVANNVIAANVGRQGAGVHCASNSSPRLVNNTIASNAAREGGGVWCGEGSAPTIVNNIVAWCTSGIGASGTVAPSIRHNCVYGNTAYQYQGMPDPTGSDGNVSLDPHLAAPAFGDLHIQPDSPCREAGDHTAVGGDWLDIDGTPRVQGAAVDIGADESDGALWPTGPRIVRVRTDGDDAHDGSSWELAKRTVGAALETLSLTGGEVWAKAGVYRERLTVPAYLYLYGGFAGSEESRSQRDWAAHTTVLEGDGTWNVVRSAHAGHRLSAIDGFTIRGGGWIGIWCDNSSPVISHNTITGNRSITSGGGIHCSASSPMILENTIADNTADDDGGGIANELGGDPEIVGNTIARNVAGRYGGGIFHRGGQPRITGNTISANRATSGAGLFSQQADALITDNLVESNVAEWAGGGIACNDLNEPLAATISGNTVRSNRAQWGGGIRIIYSSAQICDNVISDNHATDAGGLYCLLSAAVVSGNTIAGNRSDEEGAGILASQSTASITGNLIRDNVAQTSGGGICCRWDGATISHNQLTRNSARDGGGISCYGDDGLTIAHNTLTANTGGTYGGGISCQQYSSPSIIANTVQANTAARGGGIWCTDNSSPIIETSVIARNSGGGIFLNDHCSPVITNCTIADNTATSSGDGISCFAGSWPMVCNSIVWNQIFALPPTSITVTYSDTLDCWPGVGNICLPPEFVDPLNGDYHLLPTSPCIDMGTNGTDTCVPPPDDIDGEPRPWPPWGIVDMGADEVVCYCDVEIDRTHCKMPAAGHVGQCKTGRIGARNMSYTEPCDVVLRVIDNAGTVIFETTRTIGPGRRLRVRFEHCYTVDEVGRNLWTWEVSPAECYELTPWNNVHLRSVNVRPGVRASVGNWLPLWRLWRR